MGSQRIDASLVLRGLCESREKAQRSILAGQVRINGQVARKASQTVRDTDEVALDVPEKYVSRGGHKLEHALSHFAIEVTNLRAIDVGASTGGFTDCLLQRGAREVTAVDVGQGQLAWKLRQDPRVIVMEKTNARHLTSSQFRDFTPFDLAVIDCSFISLKRILPPTIALLGPDSRVVALIKPQFEAGKLEVDRGGGVIEDPAIHEEVLKDLESFVTTELPQLIWRGVTPSPLLGPAGNREFLVLLEKIKA